MRCSSVDSRRNTPVVDFGVETHPSHQGYHTNLPSVFNNSSIGFNIRGALVQGEGETYEEVQWINLSHPGRF
jgi:hypothetical protein